MQEAHELANKAIELSGGEAEALYFMALVRVERDDAEGALANLEASIALDERFRHIIAADPDLQSLRDKPAFRALINPLEAI